jgi:hypothetical protein
MEILILIWVCSTRYKLNTMTRRDDSVSEMAKVAVFYPAEPL